MPAGGPGHHPATAQPRLRAQVPLHEVHPYVAASVPTPEQLKQRPLRIRPNPLAIGAVNQVWRRRRGGPRPARARAAGGEAPAHPPTRMPEAVGQQLLLAHGHPPQARAARVNRAAER